MFYTFPNRSRTMFHNSRKFSDTGYFANPAQKIHQLYPAVAAGQVVYAQLGNFWETLEEKWTMIIDQTNTTSYERRLSRIQVEVVSTLQLMVVAIGLELYFIMKNMTHSCHRGFNGLKPHSVTFAFWKWRHEVYQSLPRRVVQNAGMQLHHIHG